MTLRRDPGADCRLYLEDLDVGLRFVSRSHVIDKEQIKAFVAQFDPQAFHLDDEAAKTTLFGGLAVKGVSQWVSQRDRSDKRTRV